MTQFSWDCTGTTPGTCGSGMPSERLRGRRRDGLQLDCDQCEHLRPNTLPKLLGAGLLCSNTVSRPFVQILTKRPRFFFYCLIWVFCEKLEEDRKWA